MNKNLNKNKKAIFALEGVLSWECCYRGKTGVIQAASSIEIDKIN